MVVRRLGNVFSVQVTSPTAAETKYRQQNEWCYNSPTQTIYLPRPASSDPNIYSIDALLPSSSLFPSIDRSKSNIPPEFLFHWFFTREKLFGGRDDWCRFRRLEAAAAKALDENGNCSSSSITKNRKEMTFATVIDADRDWSILTRLLSMDNDVIECPIVVDKENNLTTVIDADWSILGGCIGWCCCCVLRYSTSYITSAYGQN